MSVFQRFGSISMLLIACALHSAHVAADDRKVVLQISDASAEKQALVLNVANNLVNHYRSDLKLEVVAFGPGLRLLFADNVNAVRVQGLNAAGVRFSACQNTVAAMTRELGHAPKLSEHATPVDVGVGRLLDLTSQGYTLVRP